MSNDCELLELAAKAAGYDIDLARHDDDWGFAIRHTATWWNSFTDDGDAFKLLIELRLIVTQYSAGLTVHQFGPVLASTYYKDFDGDRRAAARRAITLAAAAIAPKEAS